MRPAIIAEQNQHVFTTTLTLLNHIIAQTSHSLGISASLLPNLDCCNAAVFKARTSDGNRLERLLGKKPKPGLNTHAAVWNDKALRLCCGKESPEKANSECDPSKPQTCMPLISEHGKRVCAPRECEVPAACTSPSFTVGNGDIAIADRQTALRAPA